MSLINLLLLSNLKTRTRFKNLVDSYNTIAKRDNRTLISPCLECETYEKYIATKNIMVIRAIFYLNQDVSLLNQVPEFLFKNMSCVTYRNIKTVNGIDFDVAKSAFQKYIRRGNILQSVTFGVELLLFIYVGEGKSAFTNFLSRLKAIVVEDIGIVSPMLICKIDTLLKDIKKGDIFTLIDCMYYMCNCLHTRFYSHIRVFDSKHTPIYFNVNVEEFKVNGKLFPIEQDTYFEKSTNQLIYALKNKNTRVCYWIQRIFYSDMKLNTKRYRCMKPAYLVFSIIEWFFNETNVSNNLMKLFKCCFSWFRTLNVKENILLVFHPVYVYIFENDINLNEPILEIKCKKFDYSLNLKYSASNKQIKIHDYVYDKHTRVGTVKGKTMNDFAIEGALVSHESMKFRNILNHNYLSFYIISRFKYRFVKFETDLFTLKTRCQVLTRMNGMDTYFAKMNDTNENVVVKGPWLKYNDIYKSYSLFQIMNFFEHVNVIEMTIKIGKINMFENVPMGLRKNIRVKKPYYFAVYRDLFNLDTYNTLNKTTTHWKNEKVTNYDDVFRRGNFSFGIPSTLTEKGRTSLIHAIAWRYIFEIGDFAYRNFICVNDIVYNVDVESCLVNNVILWKQEERKILNETFLKHKSNILQVWTRWLTNNDNLAYDKWYMIENILDISKQDICRIQNNCNYLISSFSNWILGV